MQTAPSASASTAKLVLIELEYTEIVWPLAENHIKRAVEYSDGLVTLDDHRRGVLQGTKQLWLIWDKSCRAALVTEIINGVCLIWAIGGEGMSEWLHLHKSLEGWARKMGCSGMHIYGRPGWMRALSMYGYKRRLVVLHKEF